MGNTRSDSQRLKMQEAQRLGHCTFCLEHFSEYHDAPIDYSGEYWIVTANDYPYDSVKHHLLLVLKRHIENIEFLTDDEWCEFGRIVKKIKTELNLPGGAVFIRFGEEDYSGGTLPHLHAHIVVPDIESSEYKPISCWVGARKENLRRYLE
jgi:diadenosine tetraphosphate (Ap4A) HIT family hydrolase